MVALEVSCFFLNDSGGTTRFAAVSSLSGFTISPVRLQNKAKNHKSFNFQLSCLYVSVYTHDPTNPSQTHH